MYRQGDVLLIPVTSLPADCAQVPPTQGRFVLAFGSATGHSHAVEAGVGVALHQTPDGRRILVAEVATSLIHDEHTAIPLPAGAYEVRQQREFDGEARDVAD